MKYLQPFKVSDIRKHLNRKMRKIAWFYVPASIKNMILFEAILKVVSDDNLTFRFLDNN